MNTDKFTQPADQFEAAYLQLHHTGELADRVADAISSLEKCRVCPRNCGANRLAGFSGTCKTSRNAVVSSAFPHMGEETCLRGTNGSGTIFLCGCSLRCVFCQNFDISHTAHGQEVSADQLAEIMISLQDAGCHNINLVTPDHFVPQILESLEIAASNGLRLPIVYNTSGYTAISTLEWLDGVIDIYLPDYKTSDPDYARIYLQAKDYPEIAEKAIREMYRQVGDLVMNENGIALRGLLVRHLVMPGEIAGTQQVMQTLAAISPDTYLNIMGQYQPSGQVGQDNRYSQINRSTTRLEFLEAYQNARQAGLWRFDVH